MSCNKLLNIFRDSKTIKEVIDNACIVAMMILIIMSLLMMDEKGIDFVYANF